MSTLRPILLVATTATTFGAIAGTVDNWGGGGAAAPLRHLAIGSWLLLAITIYSERILGELRALRADIDVYGDHRHTEGALDMQRQPIGTVRGLR
jgi:hypothetical protein